MAKTTRVRVVARESKSRDPKDKERRFKAMIAAFKRECDNVGIKTICKRKEFFESPSEKKRRKRKEAIFERKKKHNLQHSRSKKRR